MGEKGKICTGGAKKYARERKFIHILIDIDRAV